MSARRRERATPVALALFAFALALWQAPGDFSFDTKAQLHLAPGRFLADVASVWTPTTDLGHVWSGQYAGYLFPMGPFFAIGHLVGLPDWLVHRLWLGTILAVAAWGIVRLLDALLAKPRGAAHVVAGLAFVLNPYAAVLANRASVTLLGYALLPWLLLAAHRGVRAPRSWWWPAATALLAAASGAGVNAAVTAWVLVGPGLLLIYEPLMRHVPWRAAWSFAWRAAVLGLVTSLWWLGPAVLQSTHGINFLQFIEQPGTVWGTTSASEVLRLMGYWISYTGVGLAGRPLPLLDSNGLLLFSRPVVLASLLFPALALAGFAWTRRWRYGPFCVLLVLVGGGIAMAGFPEGTPLRHGLYFVYNRVDAVQFLRTSQKAAPLVAVGLALLLGVAVAAAARRVGRGWAAPALGVAAGALLAVAAWPLTRGDAVGLTTDGVPAAWRDVAHDVDRELPADGRALVLPGQLFGFYRWGGVGDPILPALARRPVAVRAIVPYADLHAMDALWTVDRLVHQQRLYPGELQPLLGLLGARWVVTATDDDRNRSGGPDPVRAARTLAAQGLARPAAAYGPVRAFPAPPDELGGPVRLPEVRRFTLERGRGLIRVEPAGPPELVDGSAEGLAQLAAFGALPPDRPLRYAADLPTDELRREAANGAPIVISDSNRRRVFANSRPRQNLGHTLAVDDPISEDSALLDPFDRDPNAETVAVFGGARYVRAPFSPALSLFPEHRPFAAFDGSSSTAWIADRALEPSRRWVEVGFTSPRDVPYVDVVPADDVRGVVREVEIAGRTYAVHPGRNRLRVGLRGVDRLRVRIARVTFPPHVNGGAGGLYEVGVPGLRVSEALRLPVVAERGLAGVPLDHSELTYLFSRTTGDDPLHRSRAHGPWQASSTRDRGDGEVAMRRLFSPPAERDWAADAWLSLSPLAADDLLDRLAGYRGAVHATSSGRFEDMGRYRASSAFDGSAATAWVGERVAGNQPWLGWRLARPVTIRRLQLVAPALPVATPALVRLHWANRVTSPLPVARDGSVSLARPATATAFRLEILRSRIPPRADLRRGVAIAELRGAGVPHMAVPRSGALPGRCGVVRARVAGQVVGLRMRADVRTLDAAGALRATSCGAPLKLAAGRQLLEVGDGPFRVDLLRLVSSAPDGAPPLFGGGRVLDAGHVERSTVDGVRVAVRGDSWLVLGQSFDHGWLARCNGHSLGGPQLIDGFANGWRVGPSCRNVRFSYEPQRGALALEIGSGAICLLLGVLLCLRRPPATEPVPAAALPAADGPARWPWPRAAAAGLAAGVVLGFVLAIRAGVVIAPAVALALWAGIGARRLILAAALLLAVAVPAVQLLHRPHNQGGYHFNYAVDLIAAHWLAVAAMVLLLLAAVRTVAAARSD